MQKTLLGLLIAFSLWGCQTSPSDTTSGYPAVKQDAAPASYGVQQQRISQDEVPQLFEVEQEMKEEAGCPYEDGKHAATVGYYNPDTGHTATYDLKVHVTNCAVIRIDFPNGGWLDEDHIPATALDRHGHAKLTDDKGRRWEVHIN